MVFNSVCQLQLVCEPGPVDLGMAYHYVFDCEALSHWCIINPSSVSNKLEI